MKKWVKPTILHLPGRSFEVDADPETDILALSLVGARRKYYGEYHEALKDAGKAYPFCLKMVARARKAPSGMRDVRLQAALTAIVMDVASSAGFSGEELDKLFGCRYTSYQMESIRKWCVNNAKGGDK